MKFCLECNEPIRRRKFCSKKCAGVYRSKTTYAITKDDLIQDYVRDRLEIADISIKRKISANTVFKYLRKYEIEKRASYIDFSGKRIGRVQVIGLVSSSVKGGGKHCKWACVCDCGKDYVAYSYHLTRSVAAQCTECAAKQRRSRLELKTYMWTNIKRSAVNRGITFEIDREWAYNLFLQQNRRCALSGAPIRFSECVADYLAKGTTASLDRKDAERGYTMDNVQWVHKQVNFMKGELDNDQFVSWCRMIVDTAANC